MLPEKAEVISLRPFLFVVLNLLSEQPLVAHGKFVQCCLTSAKSVSFVGRAFSFAVLMSDYGSEITLEGVRVNNLRNVDVSIRRGKLTVICGVSGSGKSSLAFDTLFAEGQRRYVETFSLSARQFLDQIERPNVRRIDGIPPAIAIRQNVKTQSLHSTVGTRTEIIDFLRTVYARLGRIQCSNCGVDAVEMTADSAADLLLSRFPDRRGMLTIDGSGLSVEDWIADGFVRAIVAGETKSLESVSIDSVPEKLEVVADRIRMNAESRVRLTESVEQAFSVGAGKCELVVESVESDTSGEATGSLRLSEIDGKVWRRFPICSGLMCPSCGQSFPPPSPDQPDSLKLLRLGNLALQQVAQLEIHDVVSWLEQTQVTIDETLRQAMSSPLKQLSGRLQFLVDIGLGYLSLRRPLSSLSGGEAQRVVLTSVLGTGLVNTLYVLDEPTAGLHAADTHKVIAASRKLQEAGNTVVVVEHDAEFIQAADDLVEIGPGAGESGGTIVFRGSPNALADDATATAQALQKREANVRVNPVRQPNRWLEFEAVACHNIDNLSGRLPLDVICAVTGVSGSGKSSLIVDALYSELCRQLDPSVEVSADGAVARLVGCEDFAEVQLLDQSQLPRTRRSIPATIVGAFDEIRKALAATHEAKKRNYTPGMFSFNSAKGGRCQACEGHGVVTIEMQFLSDIQTTCEMCSGRRFRQDVLEVRYRDRSVHEILEMTAEDAFSFFNGNRKIQQRLNSLRQAGLGYIRLGQSVATLSGGECQRLRIAAMLAGVPIRDEIRPARQKRGAEVSRTLFILDEPSTGLHMRDIEALMACLNHLVDIGHSVIVIEHDPDVIAQADYIVEMGPGPGKLGGRIISSAAVTSSSE